VENHRVFPAFTAVAMLWSLALGDEQFIQADVYDALHRAYVECDSDFRQSRSEFITEKLEHDAGTISIASLKKILSYNVEIANHEIEEMSAERESLVSEIIGPQDQSEDQSGGRSEEDKEIHKMIRAIDAFLKEKRRYVIIHECVLNAL
jgi:hypothetical protein